MITMFILIYLFQFVHIVDNKSHTLFFGRLKNQQIKKIKTFNIKGENCLILCFNHMIGLINYNKRVNTRCLENCAECFLMICPSI